MSDPIIWEHFQACPVCSAELGKPCIERSGFVVADGVAVGLEGVQVETEADRSHGGRQLRAESRRG